MVIKCKVKVHIKKRVGLLTVVSVFLIRCEICRKQKKNNHSRAFIELFEAFLIQTILRSNKPSSTINLGI